MHYCSTHLKQVSIPFELLLLSDLSRINSRTKSKCTPRLKSGYTPQSSSADRKPAESHLPWKGVSWAWEPCGALCPLGWRLRKRQGLPRPWLSRTSTGGTPGHSGSQTQQKCLHPTPSLEAKSKQVSGTCNGLRIRMSMWTWKSGDKKLFTHFLEASLKKLKTPKKWDGIPASDANREPWHKGVKKWHCLPIRADRLRFVPIICN